MKQKKSKYSAKNIFSSNPEFIIGARYISQFPSHQLQEIAFFGASNVGKSSLVNAIFKKKIAFTSKTPGRTQEINFFNIDNYFYLTDLLGYGFAKTEKSLILHWEELISQYLTGRRNLAKLFLLIDPTKGLKEADYEVIEFINRFGVSCQVILTKIDKMSQNEFLNFQKEIEQKICKWPAIMPKTIGVSANKGYGIFELQDYIVDNLVGMMG